MRARLGRAAALLALLALGGAAAASAEVVQSGTLRVVVSGKLSPSRLPRHGTAPIAVSIAGRVSTTDESPPPPLKELKIELNRHGRLETTGLPLCRVAQIHPASTARALAACRPALVGRGSFTVDAVLAGQESYPTGGRLLVFNGMYAGRHALLGQIYSAHPFATSFVIPFAIHERRRGPYGIVLTATLPAALTSWGHVTGLDLRLARRYGYGGRRRSFVSAGCPAADGFPGALFTLARTTFVFAGGERLSSGLVRDCKVRGGHGR